ncbi:MAG TPA: EF-P lysine aminoacylase EpmA [Thermoanaerobaculia bacterium]|nr:EF-P lysine aminoacylase EpmA [Thermoanaerobaculia bacterium]
MTALESSWRPTAPLEHLRRRAELLRTIRSFFHQRGVLEVETPQLAAATVTDLHLASLSCQLAGPESPRLFLQTSPEFAMKRLLAAGSGAIFQICKAFRDDERGRRHNPEFSLLEWYRPAFDHHRLMDEMDQLLAATLGVPAARRLTYAELFEGELGVDPHRSDEAALTAAAERAGLDVPPGLDRDGLLHLLLACALEPRLGFDRPAFLFDFPASQAALARLRPGTPAVAERFEVYVRGMELANGFHELADPGEQRRRFEADLAARRNLGLPEVPIDEHLLAALEAGLPDCAGVALGLDRLVMLALGADSIEEVLAFPIERA